MFELPPCWPMQQHNENRMSIVGFHRWAGEYMKAARLLMESEDAVRGSSFFCGPLLQSIGIVNELVLKSLLRGFGATESEIRTLGHCTHEAYMKARHHFDEVAFINEVIKRTAHLPIPDEILAQLESQDEPDPWRAWRFYPNQLRVLDLTYNRPHRTRYVTPGAFVSPEPQIVMAGADILHDAMYRRLDPQQ